MNHFLARLRPPFSVLPLPLAVIFGMTLAPQKAISQISPPIFENVTVSPRFSPDPVTLRGISGGSLPARGMSEREETATGPCVGFVDGPPDHVLTLTDFFDFLSVEIQSSEDTTLVVKGPGGAWCNDDISGRNPAIAGQWQAGSYFIWVGSYQQHEYYPYIMRVTQIR